MKKNIFIITCLLITQFIFAQVNPGGVAGAARWYKADAGVTTGATMTWADQTANAVNVTQATAANQPAYNTASGLVNFNPKLTFNGTSSRLSNATGGVAFGTGAQTVYYIAASNATTIGQRIVVSYGAAGVSDGLHSGIPSSITSKMTGAGAASQVIQTNQWVNGIPNLTRTGYNGGAATPFYMSSNGVTETTGANSNINITTTNLSIGTISSSANYFWNGDISEVIIYPGKHTVADYNRVESYLSVKYGITKANDYIASNSTTTYWNATTNAGYNNNIAGIGRDDNTDLHQRQSQSINTGVQPIIGNNSTIGTTNTAGAANFATDNNFMLWGSDTGSDNIATAFVFGGVNARMGKIWKVQETNTVGTVKVAIKKSDFFGTNQNLVVSNDATFDSSDTMTAMTEETIGGVIYYTATVDFTNGQFFTFASYVNAPGGILGSVGWYKSDDGATTTTWADKSSNANNLTGVGSPSLSNYINFNKVATFNGTNQSFGSTTMANLPLNSGTGETIYSVLFSNQTTGRSAVHRGGGTVSTNPSTSFFIGSYSSPGFIVGGAALSNNAGYNAFDSSFPWTTANIHLLTASFNTSSIAKLTENRSTTVYSSTIAGVPKSYTSNTAFHIGSQNSNALWWDGIVAEVIDYPIIHSALEKDKIESYLALKWGLTRVVDYIASDGTTKMWDITANSGYNNNIAGIGRDDTSRLHQRQSQSQNTGVQPIIGNSGIISTSNAPGAMDFAADKSFIVWGSDTGSDAIATPLNDPTGIMNYRMGKIWKVQTNLVTTEKIAIKKSDFTGSFQKLIFSNNATFATFSTAPMIEETIGGVVYYTAVVAFTNGQFFTFASYVSGPGGLINNIATWLKADAGAFSDAGITNASDAGTIQQWNDQSASGYNLSQATAGDRPVFYNTTANKLVNFNPSVAYVSTDRLVNATRLMPSSSAHSFFGVAIDEATATGYKTIFSSDDSDNNFVLTKTYASGNGVNGWMNFRAGDYRLVNGANNNYIIGGNGFSASGGSNGVWNGTTYIENLGVQPQVFGLLGAGSNNNSRISFIDGYKATNTANSFSTGTAWFGRMAVGAYTGGANPFTGRIPEIVAYSTQLTDAEAQKVNSYLAIKYGTTLGQGGVKIVNNNGNNYNYLASDGTVIWNASASSTYKYHIAGIGKDYASALNQKQSQSQNATQKNQVIFGLGTVAATNAANANTITSDKQFVLWGDNGASGATGFSDSADTTIFSRLARTWFVDNSGSYAQDTQLLIPVALTTGGSSPKLILNTSSGAFASGTNTYIPLSATTTVNTVSYYVANLTAAQMSTDFYFTVATNQKAPGGVGVSLSFWLNMDSFTPSNWSDLSGNSNNFLSTAANRQPPLLAAAERTNFQPAVDFRSNGGTYNGDSVQNLMHKPAPGPFSANFTDGTLFSAMSRESDAGYRDVIGFGNGANISTVLTTGSGADSPVWTAEPSANHTMSLYPSRGPGFATTTPTTTNVNQVLTTSKTHIPDITWRYNQANGIDHGLDGNEVNVAETPTAIYGASGALIDGQAEINDGRISELIGYERALTLAEKQRVRSYMAIKYGVTQSQAIATNYVNSAGTVVWDATANSGFKADIAGIGLDAFATLNQVMSKSINNAAEPLISLSAVPSSASNTTQSGLVSFDNLSQYLVWGNNATRGFTAFTNAIDANIDYRLTRVWKAQTTNYNITGDDNIVFNFPIASVKPFLNSGSKTYLVLSTTSNFSSGNYLAEIPATINTIDGRSYVSITYNVASNVFAGLVSNGSFYFTVAGKGSGPGGVLGIFWNRADKDLLNTGTNVTKWTDQMYGIESMQVADNTLVPQVPAVPNTTLFNFNPYVDFTANTQTLGNESVAPAEGFTNVIEQFFITKDDNYTGRLFSLTYDLKSSAGGGTSYDWNTFNDNGYATRDSNSGGTYTTLAFAPALSTTLTNMTHYVSGVAGTKMGYRANGSTVTNTTAANYNFIGQGGFVYGSNSAGTGLVGDDNGIVGQVAEHLIVGEALTAVKRRQVESYLAIKYGITISDLTSDAAYRDGYGNPTFTTDATYKYDIFGLAKDGKSGIEQRISKSINNDAGQATNIITASTDTNFANMNLTHADTFTDGQFLIFASNGVTPGFAGGSAISTSDGIAVFTAAEVFNTIWKVQDKGGASCVNLRFNNATLTAVTAPTKYYFVVASDAAFTQNVIYKEVTRDSSGNIDVVVNFGDNTNGTATTGNYFTLATKNLGLTKVNVNTVITGINTIPSLASWKPTLPNTYLEINSNNKGVILSHVAGTSSITTPLVGMMIYDTNDSFIKVYDGTAWRKLGESGSSASFCN